jgi:transcriptional regulator with XRE-family HTH domain|tara:strand:- start:122 stop:328 length:207 start_codon:yes stop_codon:yes gene_type:complete
MTLKDKMELKEISARWLANRVGLSRPTLLKYLEKPDEFKIKHAKRILKCLEITERDALINYFKANSYE